MKVFLFFSFLEPEPGQGLGRAARPPRWVWFLFILILGGRHCTNSPRRLPPPQVGQLSPLRIRRTFMEEREVRGTAGAALGRRAAAAALPLTPRPPPAAAVAFFWRGSASPLPKTCALWDAQQPKNSILKARLAPPHHPNPLWSIPSRREKRGKSWCCC